MNFLYEISALDQFQFFSKFLEKFIACSVIYQLLMTFNLDKQASSIYFSFLNNNNDGTMIIAVKITEEIIIAHSFLQQIYF